MTRRPERLEEISSFVDSDSGKIQDFLVRMLRIRAVNPRMGGKGELERARFLRGFMEGNGLEVQQVDVKDPGSPGGTRPNLSAKLRGKDERRTLWYISHMDTVPEGSMDLWKTDPFDPTVSGGKIIARGAEDNGQSLAASLFALLTLKELEYRPPFNVGVWFVADEEFASDYGIKPLLDRGYFRKTDLIVVPDAGTPTGTDIEIAEKGLLWMKITTKGKQVHASLPKKGLNARRVGMRLALDIDSFLHRKYKNRDVLYDYPKSTFEPTKVEENVGNVNTLPGVDVSYFDCRVLPEYDLGMVSGDVKKIIREYEEKYGARIELQEVEREPAGTPTSGSSEVAVLLRNAVEEVSGVRTRLVGIGGQTVGNLFRRKGIPTAVWSTIEDVPHEPNEYSKVSNLINDTKVFASAPVLA